MAPVDKQPSVYEEASITKVFIKDPSVEVHSLPSKQTPADEALVENVSTESLAQHTTDVPVVKLESVTSGNEPKDEVSLELDPVSEDLSNIKKEQVPTIDTEGAVHIETK